MKRILLIGIILMMMSPIAADTVSIDEDIMAMNGKSVIVQIIITDATNVGCAHVHLTYNPSVVNMTGTIVGDFTGFFGCDARDASNGSVTIVTYRTSLPDEGLCGNVTMGYVQLHAIGTPHQVSKLSMNTMLYHPDGTTIEHSTDQGSLRIGSVFGDIDGNGVVNNQDVLLLKRYVRIK